MLVVVNKSQMKPCGEEVKKFSTQSIDSYTLRFAILLSNNGPKMSKRYGFFFKILKFTQYKTKQSLKVEGY